MLLSSISRSLSPLFPSSGPSHGPWEGRGKTKRKEMWESGYEKERSLTFFHGGREESLFPPGTHICKQRSSSSSSLYPLPSCTSGEKAPLQVRPRKEGRKVTPPATLTSPPPPVSSLLAFPCDGYFKFRSQEPSLSYNEGDYDLLHMCVVPLVWCW